MTAPYQEKIRPSAVWYVIGAVVLVGSLVAGIAIGVGGALSAIDSTEDFQRIEAQGEGTVTFDDPGGYVLYLEGDTEPAGNLATDDVALTPDREDGRPLAMERYDTSLTYDTNGRTGKAELTFEVVETGTYRLEVAEAPAGATSVAVGESFGADLVMPIVIAAAVGFGGFVLGTIILIVTGVRRGRAKRTQRLQARPAAAPAPGPGWPPPPPQ